MVTTGTLACQAPNFLASPLLRVSSLPEECWYAQSASRYPLRTSTGKDHHLLQMLLNLALHRKHLEIHSRRYFLFGRCLLVVRPTGDKMVHRCEAVAMARPLRSQWNEPSSHGTGAGAKPDDGPARTAGRRLQAPWQWEGMIQGRTTTTLWLASIISEGTVAGIRSADTGCQKWQRFETAWKRQHIAVSGRSHQACPA